ncbi:MAG: hypothetical protein LBM98_10745 [Oscillospiraceae bacterium]|nr:hypothetical protein [Oscillospiraceae bacterium]
MRAPGSLTYNNGLGAKQSSSSNSTYVCYAPGTGLPRRFQFYVSQAFRGSQ